MFEAAIYSFSEVQYGVKGQTPLLLLRKSFLASVIFCLLVYPCSQSLYNYEEKGVGFNIYVKISKWPYTHKSYT